METVMEFLITGKPKIFSGGHLDLEQIALHLLMPLWSLLS